MRKRLSIAAGAALLLLLGYVLAGPFLAMNGIRNIVAAERDAELARFVDFQRLHADLAPQLRQQIAREIAARAGPGMGADTAAELAAEIATPAIDAIASPRGIAALLRGDVLAPPAAQAGTGQPQQDVFARARKRFVSPSRFEASVDNAVGQPVTFRFERGGLGWKLVGLQLPPSA